MNESKFNGDEKETVVVYRDIDCEKLAANILKAKKKDVFCLLHPKYEGRRKPRTKLKLADGCLCELAYAFIQAGIMKEEEGGE